MTVTEVAAKYVFEKLGKGQYVVCVDFNTSQYIDLKIKSVDAVQKLIAKTGVKFFQLENEE